MIKSTINLMKNNIDKENQRNYERGYFDGIKRAIAIVDKESMDLLQQEVIILKLEREIIK